MTPALLCAEHPTHKLCDSASPGEIQFLRSKGPLTTSNTHRALGMSAPFRTLPRDVRGKSSQKLTSFGHL